MSTTSFRIHKLLAQMGLGSRRAIELLINEGKIQVNGRQAKLGQSISMQDRVIVAGKMVHFDPALGVKTRVLMYHKQEGELCAERSEDGMTTVFMRIPPIRPGKWVMVGRLDINTSGLLLFTNNGELAHRMMHPRYQVTRRYAGSGIRESDG